MAGFVSTPLQVRPLRSSCFSSVKSQLLEINRGHCEQRSAFALLSTQKADAEKYSVLKPEELTGPDADELKAVIDGAAAAEVQDSHAEPRIVTKVPQLSISTQYWRSHLPMPIFGERHAMCSEARSARVRCSLLGGLSDNTPEGNAETFVVGQKVKVSQSLTFMHVPGNKGGYDARGLTGTVLRVYTEANLSSNREIKVQFEEPKKWIGHFSRFELQT